MRKIKEVLRLRFEVGLGLRAIARSCAIGLGTAHEYLQRAEAAGVTWPLGEDWDEGRLEVVLFGGPPRPRPAALPMPDFAELHRQRQLHPHLTQQLLLGRVPSGEPGRLSLLPFLRALSTLARQARCRSAPGAQGGREAICRLGRRHYSDLRSSRRADPTGAFIRRGVGSKFVHLCRGYGGRAVGQLDRRSRSSV